MTFVWTPDPGCLGAAWDDLAPEVQQRSLMLASSALQTLTYGRVGTAPVTIRPCPGMSRAACRHAHEVGLGYRWFVPYVDGLGQWRNEVCGCTIDCTPLSEIDLPGPVGFIDSFKIDGVEQDLVSGNWRLDNGHLLVWQGSGPSPVPSTQAIDLPDTEPGTWSITYSRSHPVSADGQMAVAYLAMEFAKACQPKAKCSLPRGVTNVVRNGVSFSVEAGLFPGGLTGIDIVDQFILKWAPAGSPTRNAVVFDPSRAAPRRIGAVPTRGL